MDKEELIEMFRFLQKAGANPQLCDTEVPYYETSVRAGIPAENWAEDAFMEMMMLPRGMLRSNPAFIVDVCGDSMVDAGIEDGDRAIVLAGQKPRDGDIVVVRVDDGYTVKCYYEDDEGRHWLVARNEEKQEEYRPILLDEEPEVKVFGVVWNVMKPSPRASVRELRKVVNKEVERRRKNEDIPEWKVLKAIRDISEEIEVARLWFAVYRPMTDLSVVKDGDIEGFCKMVRDEVPHHAHLPTVAELQRLEIQSFTKSVVLWDENDAPVRGKRFKLYKEIARKTEKLLLEA